LGTRPLTSGELVLYSPVPLEYEKTSPEYSLALHTTTQK